MESGSIVIIGSGNVATHLAQAFDRVIGVRQVCSPCIEHATALCAKLRQASPVSDPADISTSGHLYIIAVSDSAVADVARRMPRVEGIVAHTSGSVPMHVLKPASPRYGVLYPLQTFSKQAQLDMSAVPFFTEAADADTLAHIDAYAYEVSTTVKHADSEQRTALHLAAVLACNMANHLWALASDVLERNGYTLEVLRPLLEVTLDKAFALTPARAQTGPAARRDTAVMQKHMAMLEPDVKEIYRLLSQSIMNKTLTN